MKGAVLIALLVCALPVMASGRELQAVSGPGFQGVIFTPERVHEEIPGYYQGQPLWTPSREAVLKAERDLPAALAEWTSAKPEQPGPNFPHSCPAKTGTNLKFTARKTDPRPDSVIDGHSFLIDVAPRLAAYKRQYVGVVMEGKKLVLLSFVSDYLTDNDCKNWGDQWVAILGGGDLTWSVLYDPSTRTFTDWEE